MLHKIGLVWVVLCVLSMTVASAATTPAPVLPAGVQQQVAEQQQPATPEQQAMVGAAVAKAMNDGFTAMQKNVNDNNDANFAVFDQRVAQMLNDTKMRVIVGGLGAVLVANAVVGLVMAYYWRRYSFETYQKDIIGKQEETIEELKAMAANPQAVVQLQGLQGLQEMQQPEWRPERPQDTLGAVYGPVAASEMTQMNAWQSQPVNAGGWTSPLDVQRYDFQQHEDGRPLRERVDNDWG